MQTGGKREYEVVTTGENDCKRRGSKQGCEACMEEARDKSCCLSATASATARTGFHPASFAFPATALARNEQKLLVEQLCVREALHSALVRSEEHKSPLLKQRTARRRNFSPEFV